MAQLGQRKLKYQRPGLFWHPLHEAERSEPGEEEDGTAG